MDFLKPHSDDPGLPAMPTASNDLFSSANSSKNSYVSVMLTYNDDYNWINKHQIESSNHEEANELGFEYIGGKTGTEDWDEEVKQAANRAKVGEEQKLKEEREKFKKKARERGLRMKREAEKRAADATVASTSAFQNIKEDPNVHREYEAEPDEQCKSYPTTCQDKQAHEGVTVEPAKDKFATIANRDKEIGKEERMESEQEEAEQETLAQVQRHTKKKTSIRDQRQVKKDTPSLSQRVTNTKTSPPIQGQAPMKTPPRKQRQATTETPPRSQTQANTKTPTRAQKQTPFVTPTRASTRITRGRHSRHSSESQGSEKKFEKPDETYRKSGRKRSLEDDGSRDAPFELG